MGFGVVLCVSARLRNTGRRAARTVAQLYLELSTEAGHPAPLLKGFRKTGIMLPGTAAEVTFELRGRDLSYYSLPLGGWARAASGVVHVGESSADIRQSLVLPLAGGAGTTSTSTWLV